MSKVDRTSFPASKISFPASKLSLQKPGGHPLITIALFSGLGLLVTLVAILCGVQGAWF